MPGDVEEEIEEIEEDYDDDFDDEEDEGEQVADGKDAAASAAAVELHGKEAAPAAAKPDLIPPPPALREDETLEERIKRKQEEALYAKRVANKAAADDALSVARARLAAGDHAGAREAVTKARKLFVATGIENKEVAELSEAIGRKEAEAAEQHKAQEEAARKKAGEMAAEAAANFKAEAELAEKTAKEEAAARKAAEEAADAEVVAAAAAKAAAEEGEGANAAEEAARVTAQEQRAAAAAFAEKKRREKLARESAEAAAAEADARPRQAVGHEGKTRPAAAASSVPKSGQSSSARQLPSAQARLGAAAQELPAELMAGRGSERSLRSDGKQRPSDKAESGAGGAEKEAAELTQQQRKLAPPEMTIQTAPSPKQRAPSEAEAQTPLSATLAPPRTPSSASSRHSLNESVDDFGIFLSSSTGDFSNLQPDPQYWNTVTGYLEDADVHSTGIVSEFTATRIIQGLRLPVSEDTWRHAMALSSEHLVAAQGKRKGAAMPEPGVRYRELVSELEHMHELALRQQRIDAVLAAITHKSAAHLSAAIRSLPQSTLSDHSELEAALLAVLRDEPVSLPEHLVQTALELGSKGGELSAERLLNKLAKSVEKDPFGSVRKKLQDKYGLLKNAFQSIAHLPGGKKNAQGELEISMVQLRSALLGLGDDLSIEDTEQIVSLADADGSGSIDYKEFITMFSKSITAVRSRRTVMPARQRSTAQAPASERSGASSAFDPAEELMLRQLSESCWSLGEAFRALDKDGSGVIVCSELRGKLRDLGIDLSFNDMQRILAKVDANNDGSISYSEFVSRYRVQDVKSSAEAKSDTVMALSSAYQTPMQAYLAACGGDGASMLTRPRLKAFIRGLGLRLHAQTIEQLCNDVDGRVSAGADARTQQPLADFVPFVEFLRLFRCEPQAAPPDQASAAPSPLSRRFSASAASFLESDDSLLVQLEDALRERMRSAFGTLKSAFSSIDKDKNGVISRKELRDALTTHPLNLGLDAATINAILERADSDANGKLDFLEFSHYFSYGAFQDARRQRELQLRRRNSKTLSLSREWSGGAASLRFFAHLSPSPPLLPEAQDRFWNLLQLNFADLSLAFHFLHGSDLQVARDGSFVSAVDKDNVAGKARTIREDEFVAGVARVELLHRLRKASAEAAHHGFAEDGGPSKRGRKASAHSRSNPRNPASALRMSWPVAAKDGESGGMRRSSNSLGGQRPGSLKSSSLDRVRVESRRELVLEVLIGCPDGIPASARAKFVELVCRYPAEQTRALLQKAERERRRREEAGTDTAWPEFGDESADDGDSVRACSPARELGITGDQAISIFRNLDLEADGYVSEASLVRGLSAWLLAAAKKPQSEAAPGPLQLVPAAVAPSLPVPDGATASALAPGAESLESVPEEQPREMKQALEGGSDGDGGAVRHPRVGENEVTGSVGVSAAGGAAPAASRAAVLEGVRSIKIDAKLDKALAKQLAVMRQEDVCILQAKLGEVQEAHNEAAARMQRLGQREESLRQQEASLKQLRVEAEERERALQERDKAISEREASTTLLRAEILHKAHELEATARALQQRKAAVEHRERMLEKQTSHVQQLQALATHTFQQHEEREARDGALHLQDRGNQPSRSSQSQDSLGAGSKAVSIGQGRRVARGGDGRRAVDQGRGLQRGGREKELQALAVVLQGERDGYFRQLQAVERLVDTFDGLPNTPEPLLDALRQALYGPA